MPSPTSSRCSRATSGCSPSCRSRSTRHVWADPREPALRRHRRSVQEVGRRQRRRLLPVRADRSRAHLPDAGQARRRGVLLAHGVRRSARRPLLGAHRRHRQRSRWSTSTPTATSSSFSAPNVPRVGHGACIKLEPDAVCAITRDYLGEPANGRRAAVAHRGARHPAPRTARPTPTSRAASAPPPSGCASRRRWCRSRSATPNTVDDPYPVPTQTFGWAAGDAAYAMGSFELADDEALVIHGRSPECAFWNLCLWNPFLHTYNYDYERVTINGGAGHVRARRVVDDRRRGRAIPAIRTGCPPRATRAAASGSAGSCRTKPPPPPT